MSTDQEYSRPLATALELGDLAEDRHRFLDKRVLLTGEAEVLASNNGRSSFLAALHLLSRFCRNLTVVVPPGLGILQATCNAVAEQIAFGSPITIGADAGEFTAYDAILNVGITAHPHLNWTVINSNGWLARVSSSAHNLSPEIHQANPIGALAAACLGSAEVFKRLIRLKPQRGKPADGLTFSLYNYQTGTEAAIGPELPPLLLGAPLVAGAGAIGNGIVYLLRELRLSGPVLIVDRQAFGEENLGTCMLLRPVDVGRDKALVAAEYLNQALPAHGFREDLAAFQSRLGPEIAYPAVILNGLDNIEARHSAQGLWPDLLIDGAIGAFVCQVSRHPWGEDVACARCLFRVPAGEAAEARASRATGLNPFRIGQAEMPITEADINQAPVEKQAWLKARLGKRTCAVVEEAMAQALSDEQLNPHFAPSVPFVAGLSASMVVGEFVKHTACGSSPLASRFQFDILRGPQFGLPFDQGRRQDCLCVTRQTNIDRIRKLRRSA